MLIHSIAFQRGPRFEEIPVEAVSDYLKRPDGFTWIALRDATQEELEKMQEEFDLPHLAIEDACHGHQRPKLEEYDGEHFFAVMHLLTLNEDEDDYACGELNVFVGDHYVLSVRNRSPQAFLGVRHRCEQEPELLSLGAGFVFYALMDAVVDHYLPLIDRLESELESVEDCIFAEKSAPYRDNIARLYAIKRRITTLKHAVAPLMEAAGKLHSGRTPRVTTACQEYFRDVHDHLTRINGALDTLREMTATAIQVNLSLVTIDVSEVNKRLAAWAGIFATVTAFAGVWGMNFKYMPELDWPWGYPAALALIVGASGFLYYRFKKTGWL
jgi:magnesium transporter